MIAAAMRLAATLTPTSLPNVRTRSRLPAVGAGSARTVLSVPGRRKRVDRKRMAQTCRRKRTAASRSREKGSGPAPPGEWRRGAAAGGRSAVGDPGLGVAVVLRLADRVVSGQQLGAEEVGVQAAQVGRDVDRH